MDRNKPPALTSPWKIGFFVSLLLVTMSIGVGFQMTRTFDLSWTWVRFAGGDWAFNRDSFMREMLPLAVLVPLLSLFSYFLITGAVRKYKAYLDSGLDYRVLLRSLGGIDDLRDEAKIKTLGNYPELKEFLLKVRDRIMEREKINVEKEKSLSLKSRRIAAGESLAAECGILIDAISKGAGTGFENGLELSLPELKEIEDAIRRHMVENRDLGASIGSADSTEKLESLRQEIREASGAVENKLDNLATEFAASESGAKELEARINTLKDLTAATTRRSAKSEGQYDAKATLDILDEFDDVSRSLEALGEETKGVAITTALQAGTGDGGVAELVRLADEVRSVAAKFNGVAERYMKVTSRVRSSIQTRMIDVETEDPGERIPEDVNTIANSVTMWSERAIVFSKALRSFQKYCRDSFAAIDAKIGFDDGYAGYQAVDGLSMGSTEAESTRETAGDPEAHEIDGFERQGQVASLLEEEADSPAEMPDLEKQKDIFETANAALFAEIPGQEQPEAPDRPVETDTDTDANLAIPDEEVETEAQETSEQDASAFADEEESDDSGEFVRPPVGLSKAGAEIAAASELDDIEIEGNAMPVSRDTAESAPASDPQPSAAESVTTEHPPAVDEESEETVTDLYELGAVDYQPESVHHNV